MMVIPGSHKLNICHPELQDAAISTTPTSVDHVTGVVEVFLEHGDANCLLMPFCTVRQNEPTQGNAELPCIAIGLLGVIFDMRTGLVMSCLHG